MNNRTSTPKRPRLSPDPAKLALPIKYVDALQEAFDSWAADLRREPEQLRRATEEAIRTRGHTAYMDHPCCRDHASILDVYTLPLDGFEVYFSTEPDGVVV